MMYIKLIPFILFLVSCSGKLQKEQISVDNEETLEIEVKRAAPKLTTPIIKDNVKYVSSLNEIIAFDAESEAELWRKMIYEISYDENLERDIQNVFIDSLAFIDNSLIIRNEANKWYFLELDSKKVYPNYFDITKVEHKDYILSFSDSYKTELDYYKTSDSLNKKLNKTQCIEQGILSEISTHKLSLQLSNGKFMTLMKPIADEQFQGYSFDHFDPNTNLYIIWEDWLEAGHPIAINASNGKEIKAFGKTFSYNPIETIIVNFANDMDAGWTPNGIQFLSTINTEVNLLFEFDPIVLLKENWGPKDLVWKNDSTLIIEFLKLNSAGMYSSIFKQMQFKKQNN